MLFFCALCMYSYYASMFILRICPEFHVFFYPVCAFKILQTLCDILYHVPNYRVISRGSRSDIALGWPCEQHLAIFTSIR